MADLLLTTLRGTLLVCAGLFVGWMILFALGSRLDLVPHVGMYYLGWPIAFPLLAALPLAVVIALSLLRAGPPYRTTLHQPRFRWGVLLPLGTLAFAVMLLTCPLETGGTLLDRLLPT